MQLSKPQVILKKIDDVICEPVEHVILMSQMKMWDVIEKTR